MKKGMMGFLLMLVLTVVLRADSVSVVWEDQIDHGGVDTARSVAVSRGTAVVAGLLTAPGQGLDFMVRAYDVATGQTRWEDHVPAMPGVVTNVFVAASDDAAFALGYVPGPTPSSTDFFVRAYALDTGNVLWTDIWNAGRDDYPQGIAVAGGQVTIVGYGGNSESGQPGHLLDGLVRTYDARTGTRLWESILDTTGGTDDAVWRVAADALTVITAGTTATTPEKTSPREFVLRAVRARTGALLWEKRIAGVYGNAVRIQGSRVVVAGSAGSMTFLVAFDRATGAVVWQAPAVSGQFVDVDTNAQQVVAVGTVVKGRLLQSVHPDTGAVLWSDQSVSPAGFSEALRQVVLSRQGVYVAGMAGQDFLWTETLLQTYSPTGTLLHDDRSHRHSGQNLWFDLALGGKYVVLAGDATTTTTDATVRVHDGTMIP